VRPFVTFSNREHGGDIPVGLKLLFGSHARGWDTIATEPVLPGFRLEPSKDGLDHFVRVVMVVCSGKNVTIGIPMVNIRVVVHDLRHGLSKPFCDFFG